MTNRAAWHRARHPGRTVVARTKNSMTFDNEDGTETTVCTIAPLHRGNGPYTAAHEIDTAWQADTGAWQYKFDQADFRVNTRNIFNVGGLMQFTDPVSGQWVQFDPQSLNWVDENYSRQQIAIKQAVTAVPADYVLNFPNAWGSGRHFRYEATCSRLNKVITIDSAANLPAPTVGGSTIHLEAEFSLATSAGVAIYIDGVRWAKANNVRVKTASRIEFRDELTGTQILWWLEAVRAWDSSGDNETIGELECRRQGGLTSLFITVRIPKPWIDVATFPIYIDPTTAYSGAGDGHVSNQGSSWNTVHPATTGDAVNYTNVTALCTTGDPTGGDSVQIRRAFFPIDTSSIPDGDTISAATFNAYVASTLNGDNDGDDWMTIVQTFQASASSLTTADFDTCGDAIDNPTEGIATGERKDITSISSSAYLTFTLNSTGIGWINKTGTTYLGMREGHDVIDSAYAGSNNTHNGLQVSSSEETGTSQDPYLSITHAASGYTITAAQGGFTLTGQAAAFKASRKLAAAYGSLALSGQAATLSRGYTLAAAYGDFTLSGQAVAFKAARTMAATYGDFTLSGQAVAFKAGRNLLTTQGDFALTGQAVAFKAARTMAAVYGGFVLAGQDVILTYTPAAAYPFSVISGDDILTGIFGGRVIR